MAYLEYMMKCAGVPSGDELTELLGYLRDNNNIQKVAAEYGPTIQSLLKTGSDDMYQLGRLVALCKYAALAPGARPDLNKVKQLVNERNTIHNAFNDATSNYNTVKQQFVNAENAKNTAYNNWQNALQMHQNGQANFSYAQLKNYYDDYVIKNWDFNDAHVNMQTAQQTLTDAENKWNLQNTPQAQQTLQDAQNALRSKQLAYHNDPKRVAARQAKAQAKLDEQAKLDKAQKKGFWGGAWEGLTNWWGNRAQKKHDFAMEKLRFENEARKDELADRRLAADRNHELNLMQLRMQGQNSANMSRNIGIGLGVGGVGGGLALAMSRNNQPQYVYAPPAPAQQQH